MMEKFTEENKRFIHTIFSVTEHVHCMNSSKSYDEDGVGIWINRLSVHKEDL